METMGKKWVIPVMLFLLIYEQTNFTKIKKHLRITSRVLSNKLKILEALGLVDKIALDNSRKAVYTLSSKGKQVSQVLLEFSANLSKF